MANSKISALTSATLPLDGTEVLPIVQSGVTVKVANSELRPQNLKSNATTGVMQVVGPTAGTTRVKTVRDANDTILELGGSYTPTGIWNWTSATATWPTFNQNTSGTAAGLSATLVATSGGTGQSSYAVGDLLYASTTTALSKLADVATGNALISGGVNTAPSWGKIGLTTHVSGTLPTANGGTNLTSFTANGVLYASSTSVLATSSFLTWDGTRLKALTNANLTTTVIESASQDAFSRAYFEATGSYQTQTNQCGYRFRWNDGSTTTNLGQIDLINTGAASSTSGSRMRFFTANAGSLTEAARIDESQYLLVGYTGSNGAYRLQVNSQIYATSATIATSDGRYKENVQPLDGALNLVMGLNPVSFSWKPHPVHNFDHSSKTLGFIAQEVQQALKDTEYVNAIVKSNSCVVQEQEIDELTGKVVKEELREEFLGIAEGNLVALLTKAIQELKAEFDAYKAAHP